MEKYKWLGFPSYKKIKIAGFSSCKQINVSWFPSYRKVQMTWVSSYNFSNNRAIQMLSFFVGKKNKNDLDS